MMPEDFSKALLRSASSEAPSSAAKVSAFTAAERALHMTASASAGAAGAKAAIGSKMIFAIAATAVLAGGAGASGGYEWGRASAPAKLVHEENAANPAESVIAKPATTGAPAPNANAQPSVSAAAETTESPDVCESTTANESNACSTNGGHTVTFALKSSCSKELLDLFWVDDSCHEIFKGIVHPGEVFWQDSWDSHVFRLRDHATHKLVKEFTPQAVGGAPDRAAYWKGPPTELPLVAVKEGDRPITETAPPECAHGGGRAAMIHFRNDRKDAPIFVMSVDAQCQEHLMKQLDAGAKVDWHTSEGHAFRVRDAAGALLVDVPPTSLDTATYLSVP